MAKILIVEDERAINDLIKFNLELVGHECAQVFDGAAGLNEALKPKYDLLILDVMLPEYSGFDIMEYIKSQFPAEVDVLWVELMKQEDEEMDKFALENDLPINKFSVYKTVMQEVLWV